MITDKRDYPGAERVWGGRVDGRPSEAATALEVSHGRPTGWFSPDETYGGISPAGPYPVTSVS